MLVCPRADLRFGADALVLPGEGNGCRDGFDFNYGHDAAAAADGEFGFKIGSRGVEGGEAGDYGTDGDQSEFHGRISVLVDFDVGTNMPQEGGFVIEGMSRTNGERLTVKFGQGWSRVKGG
jgi:hypothetical protein